MKEPVESTTPTSEETAKWRAFARARGSRWLGVVGLVVVGVSLWLVLQPQRCADHVVARDSATEIVRVCEPLGLASVPVIAGFVLIAALLAPDLTEISVGTVTFKQEIERRQSEVEQRQEVVEHAIAQLRLDLTVANESRATSNVDVDVVLAAGASVADTTERIKMRTDPPESAVVQISVSSAIPISPDRAQMEAELLRLWEELRMMTEVSGLAPKANRLWAVPGISGLVVSELARRGEKTKALRTWIKAMVADSTGATAALEAWRSFNLADLERIHGMRNLIARAMPVGDEELDEIMRIARIVWFDLQRSLQGLVEPPSDRLPS